MAEYVLPATFATLDEGSPTTVQTDTASASWGGSGLTYRALLLVDLSTVAESSISSAVLALTEEETSAAEATTFRRISTAAVIANLVVGQTSWDNYKTATAWPGGVGALADSTATNAVTVADPTPTLGVLTVTGLGAMVADALANDKLLIVVKRVDETGEEGGCIWSGATLTVTTAAAADGLRKAIRKTILDL